jgi:C1A family cysteine protease
MPKGNPVGGHAMCIIGHDDTHVYNGIRGWYIIRNSWGREWGREGYCWAPYAYIDSLRYCDDFWVFPAAKK